MNFSQLKSFFVVVQAGSITAAASRLFVTPSALTQQIRILEDEVGFRLFYRKHSGMVLTEAGRSFYHDAFQSVSQLETAIRNAQAIASHQDVLRIFIQDDRYANVIKTFLLNHAEVKIQYVAIPAEDMEFAFRSLENGDVDLIDWEETQEGKRRGLCFYETYRTRLCAVMSCRNPLAGRSVLEIGEVNNEKTILYNSLWAVKEKLNRENIDHVTILNTPYSLADGMNRMEEGALFLMEEAYASMLAPTGHIVPIQPEVDIAYGFLYRKGNEMAEQFISEM